LGGTGTLADDVLGHPEQHLLAVSRVLLVLLALGLAWAGHETLRATGSIAAALAVQAIPALSSRTLAQVACVKPEPLYLALTAALVALTMRTLASDREPGAGRAVLLGMVVGVAACTKIITAPLALLPLFQLRCRAGRLAFSTAALLAFLVALAPTLPRSMPGGSPRR